MKKILGIVIFVLLLACILLGVGYLFRGKIAHGAIEKSLNEATGLAVQVSEVEVKGLGSHIAIPRIVIPNPTGFFGPTLATIENVEMQCDGKGYLLGGGLKCSHVKLHIPRIYVDRTADGKVNLKSLAALDEGYLKSSVSEIDVSKLVLERIELTYGIAVVTEATGKGSKNTEISLGDKKEIYGYVSDIQSLIHISALKVIGELNRGSMGIPRHLLQMRIAETVGKR